MVDTLIHKSDLLSKAYSTTLINVLTKQTELNFQTEKFGVVL